MKIKTLLLTLISIGLPLVVQAQEAKSHCAFSAELNPLAYAFTGWSVGGTYQPATLKRWIFNTGAYGFQMPQFFVDQIPGNEDEGFELQIQLAFTIGADFHPWNRDRSGVALGISTVIANFQVTNEDEAGEADYSSLYVVPRASYTWFLFDRLYLMPWLGVEIHNKISGGTQVGSLDFEPMSIQFSPNISIGYAF